jgi:dihydrodipicolinate synthase/N-acetylneuraminate lyase
MRYSPRRGLSIPAVTALDAQNRVIEEEQRRIFRHVAQSGLGADIIFACGTTGEWNRIANAERQKLIRIQADEVAQINATAATISQQSLSPPTGAREPDRAETDLPGTFQPAPIEAWAGVTGETVSQTIANLKCAIESGVDAAVVAPLSIADAGDVVSLFQRNVSDLFDHMGRSLPVFLYDNADIAINPRAPHLRTRDVKRLSRLQFLYGVKVSASRRVLGNYTKGAMHFKDKGEFGIYIGNAMLMFEAFRLEDGTVGRLREYWNRYLLHNELPIGVVAGPANVFPREWQRAWRACYAADERLMKIYKDAFERFDHSCRFPGTGGKTDKTIACIKRALKLEQVIESDRVADRTPTLTPAEVSAFETHYRAVKEKLDAVTDPMWISRRAAM